jgi:hypothetical protein
VNAFAEGGERDLDAGAPQEIHRCDGLNFFKSVRQDCEYSGHAYVYRQ